MGDLPSRIRPREEVAKYYFPFLQKRRWKKKNILFYSKLFFPGEGKGRRARLPL